MKKTKYTPTPRIYVACLAAYNNGMLHGAWIDASDELDDIWNSIRAMLKASPIEDAEEYAIHDYEEFGSYRIEEYEGINEVHDIAYFIEKHGELGAEMLSYYSDIDEATKVLSESYCGCFESVAEYAQDLTEETTTIPSHLAYYIDYEKMGRDMELSGDIFAIEIGYKDVHIFWNH